MADHPHSILFETLHYVEALTSLTVNGDDDEPLQSLTTFQLHMLLQPIAQNLRIALAALEEGKPD